MKRFFISKYKWSHDSLRKSFRRMCKDGIVTKIESTSKGFLYQECEGVIISIKNGKVKVKNEQKTT